jgi:hypothetical protein
LRSTSTTPIRCYFLWGVTRDDDPRMTPACFGDYKSPQRLETEAKLREYMSAPSRSRQTGLRDFSIAVTVAAPGTGKTRLLDDALRMPLDTTHFAHVLRLAITFNGMTGGVLAHPIAARALREFFCGPADIVADDVLKKIDAQLSRLFPSDDVDTVARSVLDALEALYFQQRGDGTLGRSVLLIDEISKADQQVRDVIADQAKLVPGWPAEQQLSERVVYLLAASGGRPRDLSSMLRSLCDVDFAFEPYPDELLRALFVKEPHVCFRRYLLASMLGIEFSAMTSTGQVTQFGVDAVSRALLNGDLLALGALSPPAVPAVSLGHATALKRFCADLFRVVRSLIWSTTFIMRDGSGKDFERVWVLLVHIVLRLQQIVRCTTDVFWPKPEGAVVVGSLACPKGKALNVFATGDDEEERVCALFGRPGRANFHRAGLVDQSQSVTRRRAEAGVVALCVDADR